MALQSLTNLPGLLLTPAPHFPVPVAATNATCNAAGESCAGIGYVRLSSGPGTSKVLSAAGGGKIYWRAGGVTFANGATNLRIGVNDVGATGLEDGTHDVYADLVGGVDTITANVINAATMTTGTKTIADGDAIAIVVEMTARGGADSVQVSQNGNDGGVPYSTLDTGSGPAKSGNLPFFTIQFDDGTMGWLDGWTFACLTENSATFGSGSTPDEYALVFRLPVPANVCGAYVELGSLASTDDFELILYSDPLGTPVAERTVAQDADITGPAGTNIVSRNFATPYALAANTYYAIALRPTTVNTLTFVRVNFGTGNGALRGATVLGTNWSQYQRSDVTGAFGSEDTTILPMFGVWLSAFDDGAGGAGGGLIRNPGMNGGLI